MTIENNFTNDEDLRTLERNVTLVYFEDGLWDMVLGFTLVAFGIGSAVYDYLPNPMNSILGPLLWFLGFIGFLVGKRFITYTRIGILKAKIKKRKRLIIPISITVFFVILTIVAVILTVLGILTFNGLGIGTAFIFGLMPVAIFSVIALVLNYYKIFIHAAIFGIAFFTNEMLNIYDYSLYGGITLIGCGLIIITMGAIQLVKFLKKYPLIHGEDLSVQ